MNERTYDYGGGIVLSERAQRVYWNIARSSINRFATDAELMRWAGLGTEAELVAAFEELQSKGKLEVREEQFPDRAAVFLGLLPDRTYRALLVR